MSLVPVSAAEVELPPLTQRVAGLVPQGARLSVEAFDELVGLIEETSTLTAEALATNTRLSYGFHWNRFARWCAEGMEVPLGGAQRIDTGEEHQRSNAWVKAGEPIYEYVLPLPVDPLVIQMYFTHWAKSDPPPVYGSVSMAWAAMKWMHEMNGAPLTVTPELTRFMRALRKRLGKGGGSGRGPAKALRLDVLRPLCEMLVTPTNQQVRDRLVVALRAAGLTWGVMVDADLSDLTELEDTHALLGDHHLDATGGAACPVAALRDWLDLRGARPGKLLLRVSPTDVIAKPAEGISRQTPGSIIRRLARAADLTLASTALSADEAETLAELTLAPTPRAARDRAVLLTMFSAAMRADEMVSHRYMSGDGTISDEVGGGLRLRDVNITQDGMTLNIRSSKTDQFGKGETKHVPRGSGGPADPVVAMESWLSVLHTAGATPEHFVATPVDRHGNVVLWEDEGVIANPVTHEAVTDLLRDRLRQLGLDEAEVKTYSSHSCKRGIATELAAHGKSVFEIVEVTGHSSINVAAQYVEQEKKMSDSPIRSLGL